MATESDADRIWGKLAKQRSLMLATTIDGHLHARPMGSHSDQKSGTILFVSERASGKISEIKENDRVAVIICDQSDNFYASIYGSARIDGSVERKKSIWNPFIGAWFPGGPEDPNAVIVEVRPDEAEFWDGPSSGIVSTVKMLAANVTGQPPDMGDNRTVKL